MDRSNPTWGEQQIADELLLKRWAGSALLLAESKFLRLKGYREISKLVSALADYGIKKGLAVKARTS